LTARRNARNVARAMDAATVFLFLVQPMALAVCCDLRIGARRPAQLGSVAACVVLAMVGCALVGTPLAWLVHRVAGGTLALDGLVILSVAILTYAFLTGVWMARIGAQAVSTLRR
jgi:hypothetical protein